MHAVVFSNILAYPRFPSKPQNILLR